MRPGATVADTFPASLTCTWTCAGAGGGTCTASGSGNINDTVEPAGGRQRDLHGELHDLGGGHRHAQQHGDGRGPGRRHRSDPGNNSATDTDTLARAGGSRDHQDGRGDDGDRRAAR